MNNWIKCSDRLPDTNREVFVSNGESRSIGWFYKEGGWKPSNTILVVHGRYKPNTELTFIPTHWQELPALPGEGE